MNKDDRLVYVVVQSTDYPKEYKIVDIIPQDSCNGSTHKYMSMGFNVVTLCKKHGLASYGIIVR